MAAIEHVLRRDRIVAVTALAVLTVLAWAYTLWAARTMDMGEMSMSGMGANMGMALAPAFRPWTGVDFLVMFVMWAVMMVGMMTPSAAPMILIYARVGRQAASQGGGGIHHQCPSRCGEHLKIRRVVPRVVEAARPEPVH